MKICIVSPLCYPILAGLTNIESAGGSQTQVILIAKELVVRGWKVSFLVGDYGQNDFEMIGEFEVYKVFTTFKKPKIYYYILNYIKLKKVLNKIEPKVCFVRGETGYMASIINICNSAEIKTVYSTAHITDCMRLSFTTNKSIINRKLYESSISKVDEIITQSKDQQRLLKANFNRESNVIYNCRSKPNQSANNQKSEFFLWIGSIKKRKQPEVFIELAKRLKHLRFAMIGGSYEKDNSYANEVINMVNTISNLEYKGFVRDDFEKSFYSNAIAVVNTSHMDGEGFPNTFIESWSYGKPTISLFVDPDNIIKENKLGYISGSFKKLVADVEKMSNNAESLTMGQNAKEYFTANHDIRNNIKKYQKIFNKLVSN